MKNKTISIVFAYCYELPQAIKDKLKHDGINLNELSREVISIVSFPLNTKGFDLKYTDYLAFKLFKIKTGNLINCFNKYSIKDSGGDNPIRVEYKIIKDVLLIKHN